MQIVKIVLKFITNKFHYFHINIYYKVKYINNNNRCYICSDIDCFKQIVKNRYSNDNKNK